MILDLVEEAIKKSVSARTANKDTIQQKIKKEGESFTKNALKNILGANRIALISEEIRWNKVQNQFKTKTYSPQKNLDEIKKTTKKPSKRPKAILFGLYWLKTGGAEKFAIECILEAAKKNICIVFTDHQSEDNTALSCQPNVILVKWLEKEDRHRFIATLFNEINFKIIHVHHNETLYNLIKYAKEINPHTITIDSLHIVEAEDGGFPRKSGLLTQYFDYHHVISKGLRKYLEETYQRREKVLQLGLSDYHPPPEIPNILKSSKKQIQIAFVGRMERQKRPRLFLLCAAKIVEKSSSIDREILFCMLGEGSQLQKTKQLASANKNLKIKFLPSDANVRDVLKNSDFLLMPSENEGVPLVAFEALTCGCIPVLSDVGACNEVSSAVIPASPRKFVDEATKIIKKMVSDEDFTLRHWDSSCKKMRELGTLEDCISKLSEIYNVEIADEKIS